MTTALASRPDRRAIMVRAWAHYRMMFGRPGIPFMRSRFAACLAQAWRQAREQPARTRLEAIEREIELLPYRANYREAESVRARLVAERAALIP